MINTMITTRRDKTINKLLLAETRNFLDYDGEGLYGISLEEHIESLEDQYKQLKMVDLLRMSNDL